MTSKDLAHWIAPQGERDRKLHSSAFTEMFVRKAVDLRQRALPRLDIDFTKNPPLREAKMADMTNKQKEVDSQSAKTSETLRVKRRQQAEERRIQDALEDDEVREALKFLRERDRGG